MSAGSAKPLYITALRKLSRRFWSRVNRTSRCWLWTGGRTDQGYGEVLVEGQKRRAHRVAFVLSGKRLPARKDIRHTCDVRLCVRPSHLKRATQAQNMNDMAAKGRHPDFSGERNPRARLTAKDVRVIRRLWNPPFMSASMLGSRYGVTKAAIISVVLRRTWRFI